MSALFPCPVTLGTVYFQLCFKEKIFATGWVSAASMTFGGSGSRVPLTSLLALHVVFLSFQWGKTATEWLSVQLTRVRAVLCFKQSHFSFATEIQELWKLGEPGDELGHTTFFVIKPSLNQYLLVQ